MRLAVRHLTRYDYAPPALRADLRIKLFPARFAGQNPLRWQVRVNGAPLAPLLVNAFGDEEAVWRSETEQAQIEIVAEGVIETADSAGIVRGLADQTRPGVFLRETPLTAPTEDLRALAQSAVSATPLETLHALSNQVRDAVDYVQDVTSASASAADALQLGKGVCQDHAHVFLAAARTLGMPARYIVGYVSAEIGGGNESHAWAEAYVSDLGWVGFDPTNRQSPTDAYIRLCCGLDAADAAPVRGYVSANVREDLAVELDVSPSQAQQ